MKCEVGKKYRTPYEPSGIVQIVEVEGTNEFYSRETAIVKFIGNHPAGYKNGQIGRYFVDELKEISEE